MCGRYSLEARADEIAEAFSAAAAFAFETRYNIAPTQPVPVVRVDADSGGRRVESIRWGLTSPSSGPRPLINARSETVDRKPAFRSAFRSRRCLVPATGFYEWQKLGGSKQPFHIRRVDRGLFAFAGIWDRADAGGGEARDACAILTTAPNHVLSPIHDRMPVILGPDAYAAWLESGAPDRLRGLLVPAPDDWLEAVPVSNRVNNTANDDPGCVEPLERRAEGFSERLFE